MAVASSRGHLVQRIKAILDQQQLRGNAGATLTAACALIAAIVVAVLAPIRGSAQTVSYEPLVGLWDMEQTTARDAVVLQLCYAELFSRSEFAIEQVTWWPSSSTSGQPLRFALRREAGTLSLKGTAENNVASGQFTFEPADRFRAALRERGQPNLTPSQYLALAQHDIGLDAIDAEAINGDSSAAPFRLIYMAQSRARLEDLIAMSSSAGAPSPRSC